MFGHEARLVKRNIPSRLRREGPTTTRTRGIMIDPA